MHKFWIHRTGDHVGVATRDIEAGERVTGVYMDTNETSEVVSKGNIPLGHKISLVVHGEGEDVIEYGQVIGVTRTSWQLGDYVHTHNIKSKRW
ncbi:UxaA family hydrolase [Alicyclobacillus dauci]|uniref:UxaA family hydrolase n=1 Tax=Alicyclobacillus dauci TaxID=1475485 RepID=A0ABY6Z4R0_9BACL|nr:UxaA family hydrolase [Alicyclobacillus dauci]WAH37642.1 UxaA family hydrolase [Alicyclobacillus dauci]